MVPPLQAPVGGPWAWQGPPPQLQPAHGPSGQLMVPGLQDGTAVIFQLASFRLLI